MSQFPVYQLAAILDLFGSFSLSCNQNCSVTKNHKGKGLKPLVWLGRFELVTYQARSLKFDRSGLILQNFFES